jgi:predicted metal-dependent enzyme (double-stranded beta helix superfamily)
MSVVDTLALGVLVSPLSPLREFVRGIAALADRGASEAEFLSEGGALLRRLVADDRWLPDAYAVSDPERYRQYLLYLDPAERFSIVSFVWGPGQRTPVHDHRVWGLVGVLRGKEVVENYQRRADGLRLTGSELLSAGSVDAVSPGIGDIHRVSNAFDDRVTISIHVYGADIGKVHRATYSPDGSPKPFVSGYAEAPPLFLWDD